MPVAASNGRAFLSADKSFVELLDPALATHRALKAKADHSFSDAMREEPCGLQTDAQGAVQLVVLIPFLLLHTRSMA